MDINGKMEAEILKMNQKLWTLTGQQQKFKLDYQKDGKLDISFVRLDKKFRQGGWNVNYPDYYLQSLAFNNPKSCTSRMQIIRIEMAGKWVVTMAIPLSKKNDRHQINITLHELLHGNGFAWPCTKGQNRGHVTGRSISSNQNNSPDTLGDMIYNHSNNGCPDLKDSIYMTPTPKDPYDPLPMVCYLALRSGRGVPGETFD